MELKKSNRLKKVVLSIGYKKGLKKSKSQLEYQNHFKVALKQININHKQYKKKKIFLQKKSKWLKRHNLYNPLLHQLSISSI